MLRAKVKDGWCVCAKCGHKLGKVIKEGEAPQGLEIKCHSCKEINVVGKEKMYRAIDLQGGEFAQDREFDVEGWRVQAQIWCDMDEDDETYEYLELLRQDKVLDFIAFHWELKFEEVEEE